MARTRSRIVKSAFFASALLAFSPPTWAGYDDAIKAYEGGMFAQALTEFKSLAQGGHPAAQFQLGRMYQTGDGTTPNMTEALKWYRQSAEQNNAQAQYALGLLYDQGYGVKASPAEAFKWFRKAADQNDPQAQFTVGYMFQNGSGVKKDGTEALKWYRRAAEQGHAIALFAMGLCYRGCPGVMPDKIMTHMWMELAAPKMADGVMKNVAQNIMAKTAAKMTPAELKEAKHLAAEWRHKNGEVGGSE